MNLLVNRSVVGGQREQSTVTSCIYGTRDTRVRGTLYGYSRNISQERETEFQQKRRFVVSLFEHGWSKQGDYFTNDIMSRLGVREWVRLRRPRSFHHEHDIDVTQDPVVSDESVYVLVTLHTHRGHLLCSSLIFMGGLQSVQNKGFFN